MLRSSTFPRTAESDKQSQSKLNRHTAGVRALKFRYKRQALLVMWTLWFAYLSWTSEAGTVLGPSKTFGSSSNIRMKLQSELGDTEPGTSMKWQIPERVYQNQVPLTSSGGTDTNDPDDDLLTTSAGDNLVPGINCTNPAILDFPPDLFNQKERQSGAVVVHFLASLYVFYTIALVCDDYFVPAIECICESANIPSDIAGASFMAVATSAPELFTNVIGTFITEGDIGVGTIVGSAVFNILAVCACCGFAAKTALPLDWYPLTRDCLVYLISVILLITIVDNRRVYWYEAAVFVIAYLFYIVVMWKNAAIKEAAERFVRYVARSFGCLSSVDFPSKDEKSPLLSSGKVAETVLGGEKSIRRDLSQEKDLESDGKYDEMVPIKSWQDSEDDGKEESYEAFRLPIGESWWGWTEWIIGWPARFVLTVTIPDCRRERLRKFYPLTFLMCIVYIALLTYVVSWLMTVIGHTLRIPDSVMGLTFIAAGTSVPEAVSSIIVARQGLGSMSISNSIGSNTFDILICLGLPWLVKTLMIANEEVNYVLINSRSLEYSIVILFVTLFLFYLVIALNKFYLDKKVALMATVLYGVFLVLASLLELNVFVEVNFPTCEVSELL